MKILPAAGWVVLAGVILLCVAALVPGVRRRLRGLVPFGQAPVLVLPPTGPGTKILFLHHSTGECIWNGGLEACLTELAAERGQTFFTAEQTFPKATPYGWNNYPFDYWNLWVAHGGPEAYRREPTLEMIAHYYDLVVWKHCFPVSHVLPDQGDPRADSPEKRLENYRAQYTALKSKMREFPRVRFLVWTAPALVESATDAEEARRARAFVDWVRDEWDEPGDNIFVWDFHDLQTEGGLYLKPEHARGPADSHPNADFSRRAAKLLAQRIVAAIDG